MSDIITVLRKSPKVKLPTDFRPIFAVAGALSFALLMVAVVSCFVFVRELTQSQAWVVHSMQVVNTANQFWANLLQAESAQRGYLITGDPALAVPYNGAIADTRRELAALKALTIDNARQQERLKALDAPFETRIRSLDRNAERVRTGDLPGMLGDVKSRTGMTIMTQIRSVLDSFEAEEKRLLAARQERAGEARALILTLFGCTVALSGIAAAFAVYFARRQLRGLVLERDILEKRVQERTLDLETAIFRAEQEASRAGRERDRVELLMREMSHRIGNNLATISALLGLQVARLPPGTARNAVESARERVGAIGAAQRRLRIGNDLQSTRLDQFLEAVLNDIGDAFADSSQCTLRRRIPPLIVGSRDAITLSVVMNELIANAFNHAFPHSGPGTIDIALTVEDGVAVLTVSDDGIGLQERPAEASSGLGTTIIDRMSEQYGGVVERSANTPTGTVVRITMPKLAFRLAEDEKAGSPS